MGLFDFSLVKKSVSDVLAQEANLRRDIEAAKREREEIAEAPMQREELAEALAAWVDRMGQEYPKHLMYAARAITMHADRDPLATSLPPALLTCHGGGSGTAVTPSALCFLFSDVMKDGLRRAVDAIPFEVEPGLPREERLKRLAALDKKIAKLEEDLLQLHRDADAAGITLKTPPLPGKLKV